MAQRSHLAPLPATPAPPPTGVKRSPSSNLGALTEDRAVEPFQLSASSAESPESPRTNAPTGRRGREARTLSQRARKVLGRIHTSRKRATRALKSGFSEADSYTMTPGAASQRPRAARAFSAAALRQATEFSYARTIRTPRGAQDLVYRMFAVAAIELYQEAYPERGAAQLAAYADTPPHLAL